MSFIHLIPSASGKGVEAKDHKPVFEKEYEKRHNELLPEMRELLKKKGVSNYSIFWDKKTNILFAV